MKLPLDRDPNSGFGFDTKEEAIEEAITQMHKSFCERRSSILRTQETHHPEKLI
jgi:hypothetical protein